MYSLDPATLKRTEMQKAATTAIREVDQRYACTFKANDGLVSVLPVIVIDCELDFVFAELFLFMRRIFNKDIKDAFDLLQK